MYLADAGSSKWKKVNFFKSFLPVTTVFFIKYLNDLFDGHYVSLRPCFFHSVSYNRRHDLIAASRENLSKFKNSSSHLSKCQLKSISIFSIYCVFPHTRLPLLLQRYITHALFVLFQPFTYNLLLNCFCHSTSYKLYTQYSKLECP